MTVPPRPAQILPITSADSLAMVRVCDWPGRLRVMRFRRQ